MSSKASILYGILRPMVELGARIFMKRMAILGKENFPKNKPVILISNHQNAMLDPVLICVFTPRQLHWLTRADVFKNDVVRYILSRLNMLPVYRERDGVGELKNKNEAVFDECYKRLSRKAVIAMFPEGTHRGKKQLIDFKKGLARLAYGALQANDANKDLVILPVGLDYSGFYDYHPEFILNIGKPVKAADYFDKEGKDLALSMNRLLGDAREALSKLMLDVKEDEDYEVVVGLRELVMSMAPDHRLRHEFPYYLRFSKKYENAASKEIIRKSAKAYLEISSRFQVDDLESRTTPARQNARFIFLGLFLPVYLASRILFLPVERFIESFIRKKVKDMLFKNSLRMAFFTFVSPLYAIFIAFILSWVFGWTWVVSLCIIAGLFVCGRIAVAWVRMYHRWRKGRRWLKWMRSSSEDRRTWEKYRAILKQEISSLMSDNYV